MTTQNNNEHLEGSKLTKEEWEEIWKYPAEITEEQKADFIKAWKEYQGITGWDWVDSDNPTKDETELFTGLKKEFYKEQLKERE